MREPQQLTLITKKAIDNINSGNYAAASEKLLFVMKRQPLDSNILSLLSKCSIHQRNLFSLVTCKFIDFLVTGGAQPSVLSLYTLLEGFQIEYLLGENVAFKDVNKFSCNGSDFNFRAEDIEGLGTADRNYIINYISFFSKVINNSKNVDDLNKIVSAIVVNDLVPLAVGFMELLSHRYRKDRDFWLNYVNLLISSGKQDSALKLLTSKKKFLKVHPGFDLSVGHCYYKLNRSDKALVHYLKAYDKSLKTGVIADYIAQCYLNLGQFSNFSQLFTTRLRSDQLSPKLLHMASNIDSNLIPPDLDIKRLLLNTSSIQDKILLTTAMANIELVVGTKERYAKLIYKRNGLKRGSLSLDARKKSKIFPLSSFRNYITSNVKEPNKNSKGVFICGLPRSGSTLLCNLLLSSNHTYGGMENSFLSDRLLELANINHLTKDAITEVFNEYDDKFRNDKSLVYVDKELSNFRWIPLIQHHLPDSVIILIERHIEANKWSLFKQLFFRDNLAYSYSWEDLSDYLAEYRLFVDDLLTLNSNKIIKVKYEDLVSEPKRTMTELCLKLGVDPPTTLDKYKNVREIRTASNVSARSAIIKNRNSDWEQYRQYFGE